MIVWEEEVHQRIHDSLFICVDPKRAILKLYDEDTDDILPGWHVISDKGKLLYKDIQFDPSKVKL